ncbi:MAG: TIGR00153 family protein [Pseudomonadota bacterium]
MASWLTQLFVKSPFGPIQEHQKKIQESVEIVPRIVEACLCQDRVQVRELAKTLSILEGEADEIKTHVRDHLPKTLFLPVSRGDLLQVLSAQDKIADCAEDLGVLLNMRAMELPPEEVAVRLRELVVACVQVVRRSTEVVDELDDLVRSSFSGSAAKRLLEKIDIVDQEEHLADKVQDKLAKTFFRYEDQFKPAAIFLWMKVFNKIGDLANNAERMTHRIRLFIAN